MTNNQHGQVPEALIDLIDAYAETRHRCGGVYNAKTEAARKAVIEALSGVQALSAAPAIGDELRDTLVAVSAAIAERDDRAAQKMICEILAASTTPPAEQQAQPGAVYAELPQPDSWFHFTAQFWENKLRDFADRTHALRMQAAPKAAPGEPVHGDVLPPVGSRVYIRHGRDNGAHACTVTGYYAWGDLGGDKRLHRVFVRLVYEGTDTQQARMLCDCHPTAEAALSEAAPTRTALPEGWTDCTIEFGNDGPEVVAYGPKRMMTRLAKWLGKYFAQVIAEAAPKAAPGEQNTVPAEWLEQAYREGWAACRDAETIGEEAEDWAFGNSTANSRMIDAQQAAPTPPAEQAAPKAAPVTQQAGYAEVIECGNSYAKVKLKGEAFGSTKVGDIFYTAPQQEAQEPVAYIHVPHHTVEGKVHPVVSFEKYQQDYADGIYSTRIPLYTAPQQAPAPLSDDTERLEWLLWKLPGDALRYVVGELADTSSGSEFRAAIDAAIAAQGGRDAS